MKHCFMSLNTHDASTTTMTTSASLSILKDNTCFHDCDDVWRDSLFKNRKNNFRSVLGRTVKMFCEQSVPLTNSHAEALFSLTN
jgi:hypothetical protein